MSANKLKREEIVILSRRNYLQVTCKFANFCHTHPKSDRPELACSPDNSGFKTSCYPIVGQADEITF
jgi:hypothetical protein